MQAQGATLSDAERRAVARVPHRPRAARPPPTAIANRCTTSPAMTDAAATPGWNGWGNGAANTRFAPNGGLDGRRSAAAQVEVGVRLRRRQRRARAADDRGRPPVRRQRERRGARARSEDRLHALDLQGAGRHPHRSRRRALQDRGRFGPGGVLRRRQGQRLRRGREHRSRAVGAQGGRASGGVAHRRARRLRRQGVRAGAGPQRGRPGRHRQISVLHLPRQPGGTRRQHRRAGVEDLHGGPAAAARARTPRAFRCRPGRRRHLVGADGGHEARPRLRRHRQRLRRSAAADDRTRWWRWTCRPAR